MYILVTTLDCYKKQYAYYRDARKTICNNSRLSDSARIKALNKIDTAVKELEKSYNETYKLLLDCLYLPKNKRFYTAALQEYYEKIETKKLSDCIVRHLCDEATYDQYIDGSKKNSKIVTRFYESIKNASIQALKKI